VDRAPGRRSALIAVSANTLADVEAHHRYRAVEFFLAAEHEYQNGERARALEELRAGFASAYRGPDQRTLPPDYAQLLHPFVVVAHELGRDAGAAAELDRLVRDYPEDADLHGILAALHK